MASEPKKQQAMTSEDGDPLMRAASQGFINAPTPEPTTEQLQRAMHPRDYDAWKAGEEARLKRANDIKNATVEATVKANEEEQKIREEADQKALSARRDRDGYRTRNMAPANSPQTPPQAPKNP